MRNKENIRTLLHYLQKKIGKELIFDENAVLLEYEQKEDHQSLSVKILSVAGGLLACIILIGFLFGSNLFDSEKVMLVFGSVCILGALLLNRFSTKIITDTLVVSSYLTGFILLGLAFSELFEYESAVCMIFLMIALFSLFINQNYILSFVSILIINGSILTLLFGNELNELVYVYTAVMAVITTFLFLAETKIMMLKNKISKIYEPLRSAFVVTFLGILIYSNHYQLWQISSFYIWMIPAVFILSILYIISRIFSILNITEMKHKVIICFATILLLAPTIYSPAISGSILIILLSFFTNYKIGFGLAVLTFIYSISMYYYDLTFTLLIKSIILFSSGILFLLIYLSTHKKLTSNEKV